MSKPPVWIWPAARREPFMRRAARNHALNFVKRMRLDREVLTAYFDRQYGAGSSMAELRASQPEARVYRNLFRHQVQRGLYRLRPGSGEMLEAFVRGDTPIEQGVVLRRTHQAVRQSMTEARKRLRKLLASEGDTEAELCS